MYPLKYFFRETVFTLAYRKIDKEDKSDCLLGQCKSQFKAVPINRKYWYADPIIFEYEGKTYVFYEVYLRKKNKGVIGYSIIDKDGSISKPKIVFEDKTHLSYPFIFRENGKVYIIPESYQQNCVKEIEAVDFPDRWITKGILIDNINSCDTTAYFHNKLWWIFTAKHDEEMSLSTKLLLYYSDNLDSKSNIKLHKSSPVSKDVSKTRSAGKIFEFGDYIIRPAQDCSENRYGYALVFNRIDILSTSEYKETVIKEIKPTDINVNIKKEISGIHTYGIGTDFEVIDIRYEVFNLVLGVHRLCLKLKEKLVMLMS